MTMGMSVIRKKDEPGGFTLLELAMVLSIAAVMLLCIFPMLRGALSGYSLYTSARLMASDIRCQQQAAVSSEGAFGIYQISFDVDREVYKLKLGIKNLQTVSLPSSVDLVEADFPARELKFSVHGAPLAAGHVYLRDRVTGKEYYVIINPVVGRVRVDTRPPD